MHFAVRVVMLKWLAGRHLGDPQTARDVCYLFRDRASHVLYKLRCERVRGDITYS